MYKNIRNISIIAMTTLVVLSYLYPNLTSSNTPNSYTGIFFLVFTGIVFLYILAVFFFFRLKKYKTLDLFDVILLIPPLLLILLVIIAITLPYDSVPVRFISGRM